MGAVISQQGRNECFNANKNVNKHSIDLKKIKRAEMKCIEGNECRFSLKRNKPKGILFYKKIINYS